MVKSQDTIDRRMAAAGSDDGDDDDATTLVTHDETNEDDEMPLWHYTRLSSGVDGIASVSSNRSGPGLTGQLPSDDAITKESIHCTCLTMGKVVLNSNSLIPQQPNTNATPIMNALDHGSNTQTTSTTTNATAAPSTSTSTTALDDFNISNWYHTPAYIVVAGYSNGTIRITEATTGMNLLRSIVTTTATNAGSSTGNTTTTNAMPTHRRLASVLAAEPRDPVWTVDGTAGSGGSSGGNSNTDDLPPIVSVSVDATGTVIAAMDAIGNASIWTVKYNIVPLLAGNSDTSASMCATMATVGDAGANATVASPTAADGGGGGGFFKLFWNRPPTNTATTAASVASPNTATTTTPGNTAAGATDSTSAAIADVAESPATATANEAALTSIVVIPTLTLVTAEPHFKVQRLSYSVAEFGGRPTCFCLDPSYKLPETMASLANTRNSLPQTLLQLPIQQQQQQQQSQSQLQQQVIVAFDTGKLVLSGRRSGGGMSSWRHAITNQKVEHSILPYTGPPITDVDWRGIEAMVWRASLLAFADCSGVKLYDTSTLQPVAHVDRPVGARPSLYTGFSNVHVTPHLVFETSRQLLVAWGDCLLTLTVSDTAATAASTLSSSQQPSNNGTRDDLNTGATDSILATAAALADSSSSPSRPFTAAASPSPSTVTRKRTVACTMAWGLDCIAAGVVPIDAQHVAVLGQSLYSLRDAEHDNDKVEVGNHNSSNSNTNHDAERDEGVELQVLDRATGGVVYADLIDLTRPRDNKKDDVLATSTPLSQQYRLLSSFAVPRSDDAVEAMLDARFLGAPHAAASSSPVDSGSNPEAAVNSDPIFMDAHLQWSLDDVAFDKDVTDDTNHGVEDDDTNSVDSDDYGFIARSKESRQQPQDATVLRESPLLVVASTTDLVAARMRAVDDAITYTLEQAKMATALRIALPRVRQLRQHNIADLVESYLRAVLCLSSGPNETGSKTNSQKLPNRHRLSLRRMKLAASSLPVLLGGNADLWTRWITELETIPGALFVIRNTIPVRDPKLPKDTYARILCKMLEEVNGMRSTANNASSTIDHLISEGERFFLSSLLAWGTTRTLEEHIGLYEYQASLHAAFTIRVRRTSENLDRRFEQTAVGYLDLASGHDTDNADHAQGTDRPRFENRNDSLFSIDAIISAIIHRKNFNEIRDEDTVSVSKTFDAINGDHSRAALDALSRLYMMKGAFDKALKCLLMLGALHGAKRFNTIEDEAILLVNSDKEGESGPSTYSFVFKLVANYHLHEFLLDLAFLPSHLECTPIGALVRLVDLNMVGAFLIENCVAPQLALKPAKPSSTGDSTVERRGTLPLDLVAGQLAGSPKLFHWYLHLVFRHKPELYVLFGKTANPPALMTQLHKKHLDLYIKYAGTNRDSAQALAGVEAYRIVEKSTPLLSFLKAVLPLGAISPVEVGKMLAIERRGGAGMSRTLALELAYILETFGNDSESDAEMILELYLKGTRSIMLAVSFAQRTTAHASKLWQILIEYCTSSDFTEAASEDSEQRVENSTGARFGALLEAAALCGADLAYLVSRIPPGLQVEGLRPRMVAAVADYRLKVELHSTVSEIAATEQERLYQEVGLRSKRGIRFDSCLEEVSITGSSTRGGKLLPLADFELHSVDTLAKPMQKSEHARQPNRYRHSLAVVIR